MRAGLGSQCSEPVFPVLDGSFAGVQIRLLMLLLHSEHWRYFPLTVQVLSTDFSKLLHGVDPPPDHVSILYGPAEVYFQLWKVHSTMTA